MKKLTLVLLSMGFLLGFICGQLLAADESTTSSSVSETTVAERSPNSAISLLSDASSEEKKTTRFAVSFYSGLGAGNIHTALSFGGAFDYFLKEKLAVEIEGIYSLGGKDKVTIPEVVSFSVTGPGIYHFLANLLYDFKEIKKFVIYGKVGAGGVGSSSKEVVVNPRANLFYNVRYDPVKDFALSIGGGFRYQRSSHWSIRVDLKQLIVFAEDTSGIFIALGGLCYSF
ncbi:MAG: outer membrane beta-barrel protein [Acidobacteriota bacterium]